MLSPVLASLLFSDVVLSECTFVDLSDLSLSVF